MEHYQPCGSDGELVEADNGVDEQMKALQEKLADAIAEREEMAQRCHELDMQVSAAWRWVFAATSEGV